MAGLTILPIVAGASLLAKAGFFAGRELVGIDASISLKTLGAKERGLTYCLSRAQIKDYLAKVYTVSREQLVKAIESVG